MREALARIVVGDVERALDRHPRPRDDGDRARRDRRRI